MSRWFKPFFLGLFIFIILKLLTLGGILNHVTRTDSPLSSRNEAIAQTPAKSTKKPLTPASPPPPPPVPDLVSIREIIAKERARIELLENRENELHQKELALKAEETRILTLRKEVEGMLDAVKAHEEKLQIALEALKAFESKSLKHLARVYESTPPAKAGPMLEKLDIKTAAGITMNMRREKAGALWAHISPQRAYEITKEISSATKKHTGQ